MAWFVGAILVIVVVVSIIGAHNAIGKRNAEGQNWADDPHWRAGVFFDRSDPRFFVPKRFGLGWTVNFGHAASWLIVALPVVIAILATLRK